MDRCVLAGFVQVGPARWGLARKVGNGWAGKVRCACRGSFGHGRRGIARCCKVLIGAVLRGLFWHVPAWLGRLGWAVLGGVSSGRVWLAGRDRVGIGWYGGARLRLVP